MWYEHTLPEFICWNLILWWQTGNHRLGLVIRTTWAKTDEHKPRAGLLTKFSWGSEPLVSCMRAAGTQPEADFQSMWKVVYFPSLLLRGNTSECNPIWRTGTPTHGVSWTPAFVLLALQGWEEAASCHSWTGQCPGVAKAVSKWQAYFSGFIISQRTWPINSLPC